VVEVLATRDTSRASRVRVPWGPESIAPCLPWCPECGGPLVRAATEDEQAAGRPWGVWLAEWAFDPRTETERARCVHCRADLQQSALGPTRTHADFQALARDPEWQALEALRCAVEPWYWMVNYVVTIDARRQGDVYRRFPAEEYLRSACWLLWHERFTAWPKSRQMVASWLVGSYCLGEALFQQGRLTLVQSKKEEDSAAILWRIRGVWMRQRQFAPWLGPKQTEDQAARLAWANDSAIVAKAEGAHHVQSYTPSRLFLDEAQLQDEIEGAYYQALPACESITLVGSAEYGWFWEKFLVDDL